MTKYLYKNKSKNEIIIVGVGVVAPGRQIKSELIINNPQLELLETIKAPKSKAKRS